MGHGSADVAQRQDNPADVCEHVAFFDRSRHDPSCAHRRRDLSVTLANVLRSALDLQRHAHLAHAMPSLAERRADLLTLQRFVREPKDPFRDAIPTRITFLAPCIPSQCEARARARNWRVRVWK